MTKDEAVDIIVEHLSANEGRHPRSTLRWTEAIVDEESLGFRSDTQPEEEPWEIIGTWHVPLDWLKKNGHL